MKALTRKPGVLYSSTALSPDQGFERLQQAVEALLETVGEQPSPRALWTLQYQQRAPISPSTRSGDSDGIIALPPLSQDLALEDSVLDSVKEAWQKTTGAGEGDFMSFEAREGIEDEDEVV